MKNYSNLNQNEEKVKIFAEVLSQDRSLRERRKAEKTGTEEEYTKHLQKTAVSVIAELDCYFKNPNMFKASVDLNIYVSEWKGDGDYLRNHPVTQQYQKRMDELGIYIKDWKDKPNKNDLILINGQRVEVKKPNFGGILFTKTQFEEAQESDYIYVIDNEGGKNKHLGFFYPSEILPPKFNIEYLDKPFLEEKNKGKLELKLSKFNHIRGKPHEEIDKLIDMEYTKTGQSRMRLS